MIERGAFGPAGGVLAAVLGFGAGDAGRGALRAVGAGGTGAASKPPD
jgi:hypothetical protein